MGVSALRKSKSEKNKENNKNQLHGKRGHAHINIYAKRPFKNGGLDFTWEVVE